MSEINKLKRRQVFWLRILDISEALGVYSLWIVRNYVKAERRLIACQRGKLKSLMDDAAAMLALLPKNSPARVVLEHSFEELRVADARLEATLDRMNTVFKSYETLRIASKTLWGGR